MRTDARISEEGKSLLAAMVGKTLDSCQYDVPFRVGTAYNLVCLEVEGTCYCIANTLEYLGLWGEKEEVSVVSVHLGGLEDVGGKLGIAEWSAPVKRHEEAFGRMIRDVLVYEDELIEFRDGVDLHSIVYTRAIVFDLEGTQLVIGMGDFFDEALFIARGPGAEHGIPEAMAYVYEDERGRERAERTVTSLKEWAAALGA